MINQRIKELEHKKDSGITTNDELVELWRLYEDWSDYLDNTPPKCKIYSKDKKPIKSFWGL